MRMPMLLLAGLLALNAACATREPAANAQADIKIVEGPGVCQRAITPCVVIAISNRHQQLAAFAVEGDGPRPFLAENAYTYEIRLKGSVDRWEPVVDSVGDYADPASFAKVAVGETLVAAVHFPVGIPARPEYDQVRLHVRSRGGEDFYSAPFAYAPPGRGQ